MTIQLIPSIDLRRGRVVRLVEGDDRRRTTYAADPAVLLARWLELGIEWAHLVDLDAAFGEPAQLQLLTRLAGASTPRLQLGGGLREEERVAWALELGFERLVVGSVAVREPERFGRWVQRFPDRLVPAVEARGDAAAVSGWTAGEGTWQDAARRLEGLPCPAVLVTDVGRDGRLGGPNLDLAAQVGRLSGLPAILSGGVSSQDDLRAAGRVPEITAAIVGRALYEGRMTVEEALEATR